MAGTQAQFGNTQLRAKVVGPLPLLNRFIERLELDRFLGEMVPAGDRRQKLPPAVGLGVLLRNILIAREPLYELSEWSSRFEPALLGLEGNTAQYLNDDRIGRCLDALFRADRATLMTRIVVHAVREFGLELKQLHNDSTSVSFSGDYIEADGKPADDGRSTKQIAHGHNKDHRPDLKQLLFILTTTADGAVPIFCHVDDGNTADDTTHIRTWEALCKLVGGPMFLYIADCKLCSDPNLTYISQRDGRFVTVIPANWNEHKQFHEWMRTHTVPWEELLRRPNSRRKKGDPEVYYGYESPTRTKHGFRVLWYFSTQKAAIDRATRQHNITTAEKELESVAARIGTPYARLNTAEEVRAAAEKILAAKKAGRFIEFNVAFKEEERFTQAKAGRPGRNTPYIRQVHQRPELTWSTNAEALKEEARTDGIFPLITNDETLTLKDALTAYKHQPKLEKRFQQFKSVLDVRPVMLHNHLRIEALLFLYFLALMIEALIERDIRARMHQQKISVLRIYPEQRKCKAPTTARVFEVFSDLRRYRVIDETGSVRHRYYDELTELQRRVLSLFHISPRTYLSDAEEHG